VRRAFVLDLTADETATTHLAVGGVFIPNATVEFDDECHIVLRAGDEDVTVIARAVQITEGGAGFQIERMTDELRARIEALVMLAQRADHTGRAPTLPRSLSATDAQRSAAGSIPPINQRAERRMAEGSISPIVASLPTQRDETLAAKVRAALSATPDIDPEE
jgi:hypothetical protein